VNGTATTIRSMPPEMGDRTRLRVSAQTVLAHRACGREPLRIVRPASATARAPIVARLAGPPGWPGTQPEGPLVAPGQRCAAGDGRAWAVSPGRAPAGTGGRAASRTLDRRCAPRGPPAPVPIDPCLPRRSTPTVGCAVSWGPKEWAAPGYRG